MIMDRSGLAYLVRVGSRARVRVRVRVRVSAQRLGVPG